MKRILIAGLLAFVAACGQNNSQQLTITGSSTVAPLISDIAKRYESLNKDVRIDVQTGGSSRGVSDARKGLADIGMVSRALKENETDLQHSTVAKDGIALIIHKENALATLENQQIIDIYTGKVENWKQLGGTDLPITVVHKAQGRSTQELFLKFFKLKNKQVNADIIIGDNEQGLKTISQDPNSIGYVSIGAAEYHAKQHGNIKLLPLDDIAASTITVANGEFPLARPLNLVTNGEPTALAKAFIQFAQSDAVHDIVEQHYFVAL